MEKKADLKVRDYFKKFVECVNLEQSAEMDRQSSAYNTTSNKETDLKLLKIVPNGGSGVIITLQKPIQETKTAELGECTAVNLQTSNNISFIRGKIVLRQYYYK